MNNRKINNRKINNRQINTSDYLVSDFVDAPQYRNLYTSKKKRRRAQQRRRKLFPWPIIKHSPKNIIYAPMTTFYYFGYGSNMLAQRLHIHNPSAKRITAGRLNHHRLDFHGVSQIWRGASATIVPCVGAHVLGAIWEINDKDLMNLERQEGVDRGIYIPLHFAVTCLKTGSCYLCRTYQISFLPKENTQSMKPSLIPKNRLPSKSYLKTLVKGAMETGLPKEYLYTLKLMMHNNKTVDYMEKELELEGIEMPPLPKEMLNRKPEPSKMDQLKMFLEEMEAKAIKIEENNKTAKVQGESDADANRDGIKNNATSADDKMVVAAEKSDINISKDDKKNKNNETASVETEVKAADVDIDMVDADSDGKVSANTETVAGTLSAIVQTTQDATEKNSK